MQTYHSLMGVETSNFWIVDSVIDLGLNLPDKIYDIFVADIAHCYEAIPLEGQDNLMEAISKLISKAYQQIRINHPKSDRSYGSASMKAKWSPHPQNGHRTVQRPDYG